jgi:nitroimidazol reductase NimA-like FMN-containing flavoprotein (pyridoxamine 5'-phosphate oxidase superfamily)
MAPMIETLGPDECDAFLREQLVGRLGCCAANRPYVVPLIYAWDGECLWIQTIEGRKTEIMRGNPEVVFEVDEYLSSGNWRSVIVEGTYEELQGDDVERGIELLVERFGGRRRTRGGDPPEGAPKPVGFRIRSTQVTGRRVVRAIPAAQGVEV